MRCLILAATCLLSFFSIEAQHNDKKEVFQFITLQQDTLSIYLDDIAVLDDCNIQLLDSAKVGRLIKADIDKAYFMCDKCGKIRVWFQGVFSSAVPEGDLYILTMGDKVHIFNDGVIGCSKELSKKIRSIVPPKDGHAHIKETRHPNQVF
ncbi:hypothetical protein [Paraflavitalea sp. CAU 1676]|uniref:hypothetical protein n=1 Tax=Paraflavitalea sp. CAU 1676 TaxID=3032598 RepID=UPI0023DB1C27|nr:hypothetical protein [Paraflavitalea sp. CAU 1676]MDF2188340.1 hypothetical protein [Paraflavitalea sp. CAU 1676]